MIHEAQNVASNRDTAEVKQLQKLHRFWSYLTFINEHKGNSE